jgi:hypothetical protein
VSETRDARPRNSKQRGRLPVPAVIAAGVLLVLGGASALAGSGTPSVTASVSSPEPVFGSMVTVSGSVSTGGLPEPDAAVTLQSNAYPYRGYVDVARALADSNGAYTFVPQRADRDTRLRVLLEGSSPATTSKGLTITVDSSVSVQSHSLGAGRTRLNVRIGHTSRAGARPVSVWWFTAPHGSNAFRLAAVTPSHDVSAQETSLAATVDPPAPQFDYVACMNPPWEHAMGGPGTQGNCPHADFRRSASSPGYAGTGSGTPRAGYPSAAAISSAISYLNGRQGQTSLAVVTSAGRLEGVRLDSHFETASVIKVMFLAAYLQMRAAEHRELNAEDRALLYPMIHISDNDAASAVLARVGESAVVRVAHESGMSAYAPGVGWWAYSQTDAADQARFFTELEAEIPHQFYRYARELLSGIEPSQSWGFPPVARPDWRIFYKTGALPSQGLFHEDVLLERDGVSFTATVLTDGDPSMSYGEETIEGVASRLLASAP